MTAGIKTLLNALWTVPILAMVVSDTELAKLDRRVAGIADSLLIGNDIFCQEHTPVTGLVLVSSDQFRENARPAPFAEETKLPELAVGALAAGGAAEHAGVAAGSLVLAINGHPVDTLKRTDREQTLREAAIALLGSLAGERIRLELLEDGKRSEISFAAPTGCNVLVEVLQDGGKEAMSTGPVIQLGDKLVADAEDWQLAAIIAHELAHSILAHRRRLADAGVEKGLAGELGRHRRLNRAAEIEADRLSPYLLTYSGRDPTDYARFWRSKLGRHLSGGLFRNRAYPSASTRAKIAEREIAEYWNGEALPYPAHLLALRESGFEEGESTE
jgi:hypothetical protein